MVTVQFESQYINLLIVLYGLFILLFLYASKRKEQRTMIFGNYETLKRVAGGELIRSSHLLLAIRILGVTAFIIGISSPVIVSEVPRAQASYVIAIDSSATMTTADLQPSRFQAAKDVTEDFLRDLGNSSEAGVISFAGSVTQETDGITTARQARSIVQDIEIGTTPGTAMGNAMQAATTMLLSSNRSRRIVLITDGENNVGAGVNESIRYAVEHNASIYPIGIGTQRNQTDAFGEIGGVNATRAGFPNLNSRNLQRIATETGGNASFVASRGGLRTAFVDIAMEEERDDISQYFILFGLLALLLEWIYRTTKRAPLP